MDAAIAKHYRLTDPFPTAWSDPIEEHQVVQRKNTRTSTARYSVLQEEGMSLRGGGGAIDAALPQNEPDPLGSTMSVVGVLRKKGLPVDESLRLRNKYLISSKSFSPAAFLRDVHSSDSTDALTRGLEHLTRSIDKKSESLKVLVENNFDRFVGAKATIEGVYKEMKDTSLNKEQEWGISGIRGLLAEAGKKADEIYGPVMENRGKEERYRVTMAVVEKYKPQMEIPSNIIDCIKRKDYDTLIEEYSKARRWPNECRQAMPKGVAPTESLLHQLIVAESVWAEVKNIIEDFKRDTWRRLVDTKQEDNFMELINILLELGVDDNPIWVWLLSRYDYLKNKMTKTFERIRVEIEVTRRKVALAPAPTNTAIVAHLRSCFRRVPVEKPPIVDIPAVTALWELISSSLNIFLSPQGGILSELLTFWETAQSFIDGKAQLTLPVGIDDLSRKHHRLSEDGIKTLQAGGIELVTLFRDSMMTLFSEPPIEDISSMFSPTVPETPESLTPATTGDLEGSFPTSSLKIQPPWSLKRGSGPWDEYAFLPPNSNSLSGVHYLSKILTQLGNAASLLSELPVGPTATEKLRSMIVTARERSVHAVCLGWLKDAQSCRVLESWARDPQNQDVTTMPSQFFQVEQAVISGMQKLLYLSEVKTKPGSDIIPPPSAKLLSHVRGQFVRSLYKALQGMLDNAKTPQPPSPSSPSLSITSQNVINPINTTTTTVYSTKPNDTSLSSSHTPLDHSSRSIRLLLTLSNLSLLKTTLIPSLISQFETSFSLLLTDEPTVIKDALSQIDAQLFEEYTRQSTSKLRKLISSGILEQNQGVTPTSSQQEEKITQVRPYIYNCLLLLVEAHSEVSTTSPSLTNTIVSYLFEQFCEALLDTFKSIKKFTLSMLLQATLDVEFVNQTLSQYTTVKASELQQALYVELDRGSDNDARMGLQKELGDMKSVLSNLRRGSRTEFLCFRAKKTPAPLQSSSRRE